MPLKKKNDVFYDGENIPFLDQSFDSILATEVLEHVLNLDDVLKEFNRILKPGGLILASAPSV